MTLPPALPWGVPEAVPEAAPATVAEDKNSEEPSLTPGVDIEKFGLKVGDKIEVKWCVEPDEGEAYYQWWKATIGEADNTTAGDQQYKTYKLVYDAHGDFDQEVNTVVFAGEHILLDAMLDLDPLLWRKEGDDFDEELEGDDSDEEEADEETAEENKSYTTNELRNILNFADLADRLKGKSPSVDDKLQKLPAAQKLEFASRMREFTDDFMQFLADKKQENAPDSVLTVTKDMVDDFLGQLAKKRRTL